MTGKEIVDILNREGAAMQFVWDEFRRVIGEPRVSAVHEPEHRRTTLRVALGDYSATCEISDEVVFQNASSRMVGDAISICVQQIVVALLTPHFKGDTPIEVRLDWCLENGRAKEAAFMRTLMQARDEGVPAQVSLGKPSNKIVQQAGFPAYRPVRDL